MRFGDARIGSDSVYLHSHGIRRIQLDDLFRIDRVIGTFNIVPLGYVMGLRIYLQPREQFVLARN